MKKQLVTAILVSCLFPQLHAEGTPSAAKVSSSLSSKSLFNEIAAMDKKLFDAFNRQDFEGVKATFSPDLEFYHDQTA